LADAGVACAVNTDGAVVVNVIVTVAPEGVGVTVGEESEHCTPMGKLAGHETETGLLKPRLETMVRTKLPVWPAVIVRLLLVPADTEKSGVALVIFTDGKDGAE
jgi:hypothetical protein